jgi:hypothetical protein
VGITREFHPVISGRENRHGVTLRCPVDREDAGKRVTVLNVRYERQPAADAIAAGHPPALQGEGLKAGKRFHRIGQPGAAERPPRRHRLQIFVARRRVVSAVEIPDQRILTPHAERSRHTRDADLGHRLDRCGETAGTAAECRRVMRISAGASKITQHLQGIVAIRVNPLHERPQLLGNDRRDGRCDRLPDDLVHGLTYCVQRRPAPDCGRY